MKNNLLFLCTFIIICITESCSRVPQDVMSEKKMRKVLYDMQMAEAIVEIEIEKYGTVEEKQKLYDAVFAKHKITQAKYDSSLIWYGENMDLYMSIYKLVLKDIEKDIAALGDIKQDPLSGEISAKDSLDIWIQKDTYSFKPENTVSRLDFDIKPQSPYSKGSIYVLSFNVWGTQPSMRNKPRIKLCVVQSDTIITVNQQITQDGYMETRLQTSDTRHVYRIFGYIFTNDAENSCIYLDDIKLMKYNKPLQEEEISVVP